MHSKLKRREAYNRTRWQASSIHEVGGRERHPCELVEVRLDYSDCSRDSSRGCVNKWQSAGKRHNSIGNRSELKSNAGDNTWPVSERASEWNCFAGLYADIFVSGPRLIAVLVCVGVFFRREVSDLYAKVESGLRWVKRSTLREGYLNANGFARLYHTDCADAFRVIVLNKCIWLKAPYRSEFSI